MAITRFRDILQHFVLTIKCSGDYESAGQYFFYAGKNIYVIGHFEGLFRGAQDFFDLGVSPFQVISQQISVEKCAHRGATARRECQAML